MPAAKAQRGESQAKETWRDWVPEVTPKDLFTRDQVIQALSLSAKQITSSDGSEIRNRLAGQVAISLNELRHLEAEGVVPRPVRQWHEGAVRALYAEWVMVLIVRVRSLQLHGLSLREIRPLIRAEASSIAQGNVPVDFPSKVQPASLPVGIQQELRRVARRYKRLSGIGMTSIEVQFTTEKGVTTSLPVDLGEDEGSDEE